MNKSKVLKMMSLALVVPLLMSNSPVPRPNFKDYSDLSVVATYLGLDENDYYKYNLDITNTGEEYALIDYYGREVNGQIFYLVGEINPEGVFYDQTIAPAETKSFIVLTSGPRELSPTDVWTLGAFEIKDETATFSNFSVSKYNNRDEKIRYEIKYKATLGDYYYGGIIHLKYNGVSYHLYSYLNNDSTIIDAKEELDLTKLTIEGIDGYRSSYETYKGGQVLMWIIYGFFILVGAAVLLIPPAIIIPVSIVKYKRRQRKSVSK